MLYPPWYQSTCWDHDYGALDRFEDHPDGSASIGGSQVSLGKFVRLQIAPGSSMIRDEDGEPTEYVYLGLAALDYGGYVHRALAALDRQLHLPTGYLHKRHFAKSSPHRLP